MLSNTTAVQGFRVFLRNYPPVASRLSVSKN